MKAHVLTGDDTVSKVVTKKAALSYGYPRILEFALTSEERRTYRLEKKLGGRIVGLSLEQNSRGNCQNIWSASFGILHLLFTR